MNVVTPRLPKSVDSLWCTLHLKANIGLLIATSENTVITSLS